MTAESRIQPVHGTERSDLVNHTDNVSLESVNAAESARGYECSRKRVQQMKKPVKSHVFGFRE